MPKSQCNAAARCTCNARCDAPLWLEAALNGSRVGAGLRFRGTTGAHLPSSDPPGATLRAIVLQISQRLLHNLLRRQLVRVDAQVRVLPRVPQPFPHSSPPGCPCL